MKKEVPKKVNYKQTIQRWVAKPLAFLTLFVLASYGMRQLLKAVNEQASVALTVLVIAALVYIILFDD